MVKYTSNFKSYPIGNGIKIGSELEIRIAGAEVVTAQIRNSNNQLIMIEQSHSNDKDHDKETIQIKLKTKRRRWGIFRRHDDLPVGEYTLFLWYFDYVNMTGGTYKDRFNIVE